MGSPRHPDDYDVQEKAAQIFYDDAYEALQGYEGEVRWRMAMDIARRLKRERERRGEQCDLFASTSNSRA